MSSANDFWTGQLTRVDDFLITTGSLLSVLAGLGLATQITGFVTSSNMPMLMGGWAGIAGVAMWIAGNRVRKNEKATAALWRLVQSQPEINLSVYQQQTGLSIALIEKAVRKINASGTALIILDYENNRILDNRLSGARTIRVACQNCGATSSVTIGAFETDAIPCQYCESAFNSEELWRERQADHSVIAQANAQVPGLTSGRDAGTRSQPRLTPGNMMVILLLMVFFWPAAFLYLQRKLSQ